MPIDHAPSPLATGTRLGRPRPPHSPRFPTLHSLRFASLTWQHPWLWLCQGWRDFLHCPGLGLFYGACFTLMCGGLWVVFQQAPAYTVALSAGFLFISPFLGLGLYYASWRIERGLHPDFGRSLQVWDMRPDTLSIFALVLMTVELLWATVSLLVFAVFLERPLDLNGSITSLFSPDHLAFTLVYGLITLIFCSGVFAISVISTPLMLDHHVDAIEAIGISLRLVTHSPGVMALWALTLGLLSGLALLPGFTGWLLMAPLLGHASWHVYRSAIQDLTPLVQIEERTQPVIDIPLSHELREFDA